MNNGYFAVVLNKKSCVEVGRKATMDIKVSDHITLAYKPDNKTFDKLNKLIDKKVDVYTNQIRANKSIEAFWVSDMYLTKSYKKLNRLTSLCYPEYKPDKLFPSSEEITTATDTIIMTPTTGTSLGLYKVTVACAAANTVQLKWTNTAGTGGFQILGLLRFGAE